MSSSPKLESQPPIIPRTSVPCQTPTWQRELASAFTRPGDLLSFLGLDARRFPGLEAAERSFPMRVPRGYAARMRRGDPDDPLLRQVLPAGAELGPDPGSTLDPVGDRQSRAAPGVLHKYRGRVLLIAGPSCAVNCRYCFRRYFPYPRDSAAERNWDRAVHYVAHNPDVREVILSGGDPLVLSDTRLARLTARLSAIPHVARLRVHTRLPVVLPERVTEGLLGVLNGSRLRPVVVIHANHPNELSTDVSVAMRHIRSSGVTLLNQSVLLRGVNDSVQALADLSERLFDAGVLPYYLHMLDRVRGAGHFEVPAAQARGILLALRSQLPGYLVPRLVRELPGGRAKVPLEG